MMMQPVISAKTRVYGVIGNPVSHSMSPAMHNAAFACSGIDGAYLAFCVSDAKAAVIGIRGLNLGGASITIPHKMAVMPYLDHIDPLAARIGAVNTIVNRDGLLTGYNTDCLGAVRALEKVTSISGKQVVIAGVGGASRAIGFGILDAGGSVTLLNHDLEEGKGLAADLNCDCLPLDAFPGLQCDILINATPLGMTPNVDTAPVFGHDLKSHQVVMDIVYNPIRTRLLREAADAGCETIDGTEMFVLQGAAQFEMWTGQAPPVDVMRETVLAHLNQRP